MTEDPVSRLNAALEGRYAIERELGEGGMATVYLADDLKHQRKVALKVVLLALTGLAACDGKGATPPDTTSVLTVASGNLQEGGVGNELDDSLVVRVAVGGVGRSGIQVAWSVTTGGGSLQPTSSTTDGLGLAKTSLTLGPAAGANGVQATVSGGQPVEFRATGKVSLCVAPGNPPPPPAIGAAPAPMFTREAISTLAFPWSGGAAAGASIDVGNDGVMDLLITQGSDQFEPVRVGAVFIFRNDGTGQYQRDSLAIPVETFDNPRTPIVFDANGDGLDDAYIANSGADFFPNSGAPNALLIQQPGGTFVEVGATSFVPHDSRSTNAVEVADVDCDGDVDVVEHNAFTTTLTMNVTFGAPSLWINDGFGIFTREDWRLPSALAAGDLGLGKLDFCDVNRDGAPDLVMSGSSSAGTPTSLYLNDGFGRFRLAEGAIDDVLARPPWGAGDGDCIDIDLDGWPDLVYFEGRNSGQSNEESFVRLFINNGDLTFTDITATALPQVWSSSFALTQLHVADMNADGWPDVLVVDEDSPEVCAMFVNQGDRRFVQIDPIFSDPFDCRALFLTDADGDGRTDLVRLSQTEAPALLRNR